MAHQPRLGAVCRCGSGYRAHCAAVGHPPTRTDRSVSVRFPFLHGRDAGAVPVFIGFAAWVLISVLLLQGAWHYSALRTGLAIAPGPFVSLLWSINAGRIGARLGQRLPAIVGASCLAGAGAWWVVTAPSQPDYLTGFLPGLVLAGCAAGLVQAPLFAAASTLPAQRATTGSAVLNTARQVGSAVGVALVVVLLGQGHTASLGAFRRGWGLLFVAGVSAVVIVGFSSRSVIESPAAA